MVHAPIGRWRIAFCAAALSSVLAASVPARAEAPAITFQSLLREMTDRHALARVPEVEYTCRQFEEEPD